jgi:ABC-type amino acid transport substrate-binding protein
MVLPLRRWSALGLALLGLALAWPPAARAETCSGPLSLATGQWEPYGYYDANRRFTGIDADMVRAIFAEAGCRLVELDPMPPTRNLSLFEIGEIDFMSGASRTPERLKLAYFSVAYRAETVGMFALADSAGRYRSIRSFADFLAGPLSLVAPRAGWYGQAFEDQIPGLQKAGRLSRFGDFAQGIRMLAAGRAGPPDVQPQQGARSRCLAHRCRHRAPAAARRARADPPLLRRHVTGERASMPICGKLRYAGNLEH